MWCTAQENRAYANRLSILTGTTKLRFSRICSSVMSYPNGTKISLHAGEATFQIWIRSLKSFLSNESANLCKKFFVFSYFWLKPSSIKSRVNIHYKLLVKCDHTVGYQMIPIWVWQENGTQFTAELASEGHISNLNKIPQVIPEIWVSKFLQKLLCFYFYFSFLHTLQKSL